MIHKLPQKERKAAIIPKIKMMADFTVAKLGLTSEEDKANIEAIKAKLKSIDQANKEREKGIEKFVAEQYNTNDKDSTELGQNNLNFNT